jgi:tagatose 6-phosphate kinase
MARILTVTPNPAIDVTYRVDRQIVGETIRVRDVRRIPGGKGLNVARVLRALGREVGTLQPLGGEAGSWIARELADGGIPVHPVPIAGETRTTVAVVDDLAHPTLLAEPGPQLSDDEWARLLAVLADAVSVDDWVVVAGSFPPGAGPEHLAAMIDATHRAGARVLVDTSGALLLTAADAGADVVKANELEVREATEVDGLDDAVPRLTRHGATVMVSRGSAGARMTGADGVVHSRTAVPDVSGNPTGAGDAATAGLVAALAQGRDAQTAMEWAAVCGAAAVLNDVAGAIDVDILPELAARIGGTAPSVLER